ncbi:MAG: tryptophan synthase subunit alpha [Acidobacteriia bacterium]|nr:tryptophan synthase subunit alpha [Terriglobia bacterium]
MRQSGRKGFIAYLTAGDPSLLHTDSIIRALLRAGVDVLEVGVPFSDPLADGPVIQRASQRALDAGTNLTKILKMVADLRGGSESTSEHSRPDSGVVPVNREDTPFVLFSYLNPIWQMGIETFACRSRAAGVDGVLLTDLIPEESGEIKKVFDAHDLDLIFLVAPTSTDERIRKICSVARGFIYAVSRTGTTGARESLSEGVENLVQRIRRFTSLPIAVGFGISTRAQVQSVCKVADAAVVGSAIVRRIEEQIDANRGPLPGAEALARQVEAFVGELLTPR